MWKNLWKSLHASYMFLALVSGIILGTIVGIIFRINFFSSPIWLILVAILYIYAFFRPNYFFFFVSIICGMLIAFVRISGELTGQEFIKNYVGQTVEISGIVRDDPDTDEGGTSLKITNIKINEVETNGTIYINMSKNEKIERGDWIKLNGKITEGFGIYAATMYRPTLAEISKPEPGDLFLKIRNWFQGEVRKYIPEREASLGLAYLLGMKNGLDDELIEILAIVGLSHIVVASGTHLGIIVGSGKKLFSKISRFAGLLFSLVLIFTFGSMVGWSASITRAAIVAGLSTVAWYYGRKFGAMRIILITMAVTLLIDPMFLVNLGWQLSFGAFTGIMILGPEMTKFFYGEKKPNKVVEIIITTISATLMCAPILLYYFGMISLISVVANVLILPTMAVTMGMTFMTGVLSFLPIVANIVGKITTLILDYHLAVMNFFGQQTMFLIKIEAGNPWIFLLYIPILAPFVFAAVKRFRRRRDLCCSCE